MVKSGIYSRIDYYSIVFNNMSFNEIMSYYKLDYEFESLYNNIHKGSICFGVKYILKVGDIQFVVPAHVIDRLIVEKVQVLDIFTYKFEVIEMICAGSGCSQLYERFVSMGVDPFEFFRIDPNFYCLPLGGKCHLTRIDFAFDLVDYKPDFISRLTDFMLEAYNYTGNSRLSVYKKTGSLQTKIVLGGAHTIYLGTGNKLLRIYDKRLECCRDGQWSEGSALYGNCDSWIRIELQCRREWASKLAYGDGNAYSILKLIYRDYRFSDFTSKKNQKVVASFWDDLIDWEDCTIIQNANSTTYVSYVTNLIARPHRGAVQNSVYYAKYGRNAYHESESHTLFTYIRDRNTIEGRNKYRYWIDQLKLGAEGASLDSLTYFEWVNDIPVITSLYTIDQYYYWLRDNPCPYDQIDVIEEVYGFTN